jgi:hypothetical protein
MNRKQFINASRFLAMENKRFPDHLIELQVKDFDLETKHPDMTKYPVRIWHSNRFCVQAFEEKPGIVRLSVNRALLKPDGSWLDGITWDELQDIKRQCGFGDNDAVEVFPSDKDIQNVANMRHLFVFLEPLVSCGGRSEKTQRRSRHHQHAARDHNERSFGRRALSAAIHGHDGMHALRRSVSNANRRSAMGR